jgi:hypothetical protein
MHDYSKGKIYKIVNHNNNQIYIGSTIIDLQKRLNKHIRDYKRYCDGKMNYISSFDIIKENNFTIELIENVNCKTKCELLLKEQFHINENICCNKYKACLSAEDIKIQTKKDNDLYKIRNPEKYKEHQEKRKEKITCICGCIVSKGNISRHVKSHKKEL